MTALFFSGHVNSRHHGTCHWCGAEGPLTFDHVVPKSRARALRLVGIWLPPITVEACPRCNNMKADLWPWEWWAWLASADGQRWLTGTDVLVRKPNGGLISSWPHRSAPSRGCHDCGGKLPKHFTRCTTEWAKQNAARDIATVG